MKQLLSALLSLLALTASANAFYIKKDAVNTEMYGGNGYTRFDISIDPLLGKFYASGVFDNSTLIPDAEMDCLHFYALGTTTRSNSSADVYLLNAQHTYAGYARIYVGNYIEWEGEIDACETLYIKTVSYTSDYNGQMYGLVITKEDYTTAGSDPAVFSLASDCLGAEFFTVVYARTAADCTLEHGDQIYTSLNHTPINHNTPGKRLIYVSYYSYPWMLPTSNPKEGKKYLKVETYSDGQTVKRLITYKKGVRQ